MFYKNLSDYLVERIKYKGKEKIFLQLKIEITNTYVERQKWNISTIHVLIANKHMTIFFVNTYTSRRLQNSKKQIRQDKKISSRRNCKF